MIRMLAPGVFVLAVAWTGVAVAAENKAETSEKCVTLRKKLNDREVVLNACDACRVVRVERHRPGGGTPDFRTIIVQAKSYVELPFRGPGYTRFVGADPCK